MLATTDDSRDLGRLYILDRKTGYRFLIDSGACVSVFPRNLTKLHKKNVQDFTLYGANGSTISTYGSRRLNLDLGLRRSFTWTFVIADVSRPILGANFLEKFSLLIDIRNRRLIDNSTSLTCKGLIEQTRTPGLTTIFCNSPYAKLLKEFLDIT